jgi:hypothetical protein
MVSSKLLSVVAAAVLATGFLFQRTNKHGTPSHGHSMLGEWGRAHNSGISGDTGAQLRDGPRLPGRLLVLD